MRMTALNDGKTFYLEGALAFVEGGACGGKSSLCVVRSGRRRNYRSGDHIKFFEGKKYKSQPTSKPAVVKGTASCILIAVVLIAATSEVQSVSLEATNVTNHQTLKYPKCQDDTDCPGDQICSLGGRTFEQNWDKEGLCKCPGPQEDTIFWKWKCFRKVTELGQPCSFSRQCQTDTDSHRSCDPISNQCECEVGYQVDEAKLQCSRFKLTTAISQIAPPTATTTKIAMTTTTERSSSSSSTMTSTMGPAPEPSSTTESIVQILLKQFNGTSMEGRRSYGSPQTTELSHDQFNTILYIGLAFFCVLCLGLISALYMRSVKEKRRSRQAIRSLLDLMAENQSVQNSYTMDGVYTVTQGDQGNNRVNANRHYLVDPDCSSNSSCDSGSSSTFQSLKPHPSLDSRLKMQPIDDDSVPKLPSPHLSIPVLPPIKKAPRKLSSDNDFASLRRPRPTTKCPTNPDPKSISAVSRSLSRLHNGLLESSASFPDDYTQDKLDLKLPADPSSNDDSSVISEKSTSENVSENHIATTRM